MHDSLFYQPLHLASHKILYLIIITVYCFDANKTSLLACLSNPVNRQTKKQPTDVKTFLGGGDKFFLRCLSITQKL